jgi:hypothetical protein
MAATWRVGDSKVRLVSHDAEDQVVEVVTATKTPAQVGAEIRKLLFELYAPGHTADQERAGAFNYDTDTLRREALDAAGICWKAPGEMAPGCGCPWVPRDPEQS